MRWPWSRNVLTQPSGSTLSFMIASETTLHAVRPTRLIAFKHYAVAIVFLVIAFLLWFFQVSLPNLPIPRSLVVLAGSGFLVFLALLLLIIAELKRISTKYVVTDFRVIRHDGILRRRENVMPYTKVERVELLQSLLDRVLRIGTVVLDTGEDQILIAHVRSPRTIQQTIMTRIHRVR